MTIGIGVLIFAGVVLLCSALDGPYRYKYKKKYKTPKPRKNPDTDLYIDGHF